MRKNELSTVNTLYFLLADYIFTREHPRIMFIYRPYLIRAAMRNCTARGLQWPASHRCLNLGHSLARRKIRRPPSANGTVASLRPDFRGSTRGWICRSPLLHQNQSIRLRPRRKRPRQPRKWNKGLSRMATSSTHAQRNLWCTMLLI